MLEVAWTGFPGIKNTFERMVCGASKKIGHDEDVAGRDNTTVNIEETSPLNPGRGTRQQSRSSRVSKGASWTALIILIAILVGFLTMLKDVSKSQHYGLAQDRRLKYFHNWFVNAASNASIAEHLRDLTRQPHVAGTPGDMLTAQYVLQNFKTYGLAAHTVDYKVLLSYPVSRYLSLYSPDTGLKYQFNLDEEFRSNSTATTKTVIAPFHAFAPSGTVTGEVVYVNYGREEDYRILQEMGVNVSGAIVIARYGDVFRGTVVRNAAKVGAIAALLYSDPEQFGGSGEEGYFPDSKWMPPSAVQRGTVMQGIGDPLTPGFASTEYGERLSVSAKEVVGKFPSIPSMPISANDARRILMSLSGPAAPSSWRGSMDLDEHHGIGRGPGILNFSYVENQTMATIRNVFAVIRGSEEPDRFVILGNHRDAWTYGAVDPNSGTAVLLEIARNFGVLLRQGQGWRPRRSIILCSWDAEEYGMIGSTEWVEQNFGNLGSKAVAYLNVDCAVQGSGFFAGATPQLDNLLVQVTKEVSDPDSKYNSVHDSWVATSTGIKIDRLGGGGSDFAAFLQHAGVPSVDIFYGKDYPVYHTRYDSYSWMRKFCDPFFRRHVAVYSIWGLLALRLADDHVLPFDYLAYADELQLYAEMIKERINTSDAATIEPITSAIKEFSDAAHKAAQEAEDLRKHRKGDARVVLWRRAFNDRLLLTERAFLDSEGLKGRPWFRHLIYAPSEGNEYSFSSFPGVVDAMIDAGNSKNGEGNSELQHEIWRVARRISQAAATLHGSLT